MADKRFAGMSDAEIEDLVRGLPRRKPAAELRGRVLARASRRAGRAAALRPAIALGALVVLLLLDGAVLGWQERQVRRAGALTPAPAHWAEAEASALWEAASGQPVVEHPLDDLDLAGLPLLSARLRVASTEPETYLQLRTRLLERGEGG